MLETCRNLLEENPSFFFWVFGTQLMGFKKLGFLKVLRLCFFVQFLVKIDGLMFEDGKSFVYVENCIIFGRIFFFSSRFVQPEPGLFSPWRRR